MRTPNCLGGIVTIVLIGFSQAVPASAQVMGNQGFSGNRKAVELLHELERRFDNLDSIYMDVVSTQTVSSSQSPQQTSVQSGRIWLRRPLKLVWISKGKTPWSVIADGKQFCMYLPNEQVYTLQPIDKAQMDTKLLPLSGQYGVTLTHLLCGSLRGTKPVTFTRGEDLGKESVEGQSLRHVRIGPAGALIDVWLNDKDLPIRIMETTQNAGNNVTVLVGIQWITGQTIPDNAFTIAPPAGSKNVNSLFGLPPVAPGLTQP